MQTQESPIRVLCVEDDALVALDVGSAIENEPDMTNVGWLSRADLIVEEVAEKQPDVLLLDLSMPGPDPLDTLPRLTESAPDLRTVIFTGHADQALVFRALEAGAWGYVIKSGNIAEIIDAIRRVSRGEFVLPVV